MDVDPATSIGEALLEAFKLIWEMYDDALENIPGEHWRAGEIDYLIPSRQVYHAVETADFYSGASPDDFPWGQRFDCGCFDSPAEGLHSREQAREYHEEVRVKVADWIRGLDATEMLAREKSFSWTGSVVLGRALYLLGHYRQHLGELNAELRRRGLPRVKWTTH